MKHYHYLGTLLFVALFGSSAHAAMITSDSFFGPSDVTIGFDDLDPGTQLTTQLSGLGVTFSAEADDRRGATETDPADSTSRFSDPFTVREAESGGGAPTTPPIYVSGDFQPNPRDAADMRLDFVEGVLAFAMNIIDNDFSTGRLTAFDASGGIVDWITIPQVTEGGTAYWGIDGEGSLISYAILDGAGGAALDSTFIDDLSFRPAAVPLPGTAWLLMATLGILYLRRRD